jgi:hypothetical protein
MKFLKHTLLVVFLLLLVLPSVQNTFQLFNPKPLYGFYTPVPPPEFQWKTWMSGEYQDKYKVSWEDSLGLKSLLVRIYNQVDFSMFSIAHAAKIVVGKNTNLFGRQYIDSYLGTNFAGKMYIDYKMRELKYAQEELKRRNILLLVIFAPDKGTYYPEDLPDRFMTIPRTLTNYEYCVQKCREDNINVIDFNSYFRAAKDTTHYPLYAKVGIHWSTYGAVLAADSLIRYLQARLKIRMPRLVIDSIVPSLKSRDEDNDIIRAMNIFGSIPQPVMAYPVFHFESDSATTKPMVLFVTDSFYWQWRDLGIPKEIFRNQEWWYYNAEVYPESYTKLTNTSQINFNEAVNRQNVIVLLQTFGGMGNIGHGFLDYFVLENDISQNPVLQRVYNILKDTPANQEYLKKKAAEHNATVEAQLKQDAVYMEDLELMKFKKFNR